MPHIHIQPDQHDMTVSAWIVRQVDDEWKCLVHYHRKIDILMQIGGHIELNQTPWQAMADELHEESGYMLEELEVLQFTSDHINNTDNVIHPTPVFMNTHSVGNDHFHSDIGYGFIAESEPRSEVAEGESSDVSWLSLAELKDGAKSGEVLKDVAAAYTFLLDHLTDWVQVPASQFSTLKPSNGDVTYKRGKPGQS